jgi:hypothetical protein
MGLERNLYYCHVSLLIRSDATEAMLLEPALLEIRLKLRG